MMNLKGLFEQAPLQDRYLYLASMGYCVMLADWAVALMRSHWPARRDLLWAAAATVILVCAIPLWNVQGFWHDDLTLFGRCVEIYPESAIWRRLLAATLEQRADLAGAEGLLQEGLKFDPDDGRTLYRLAIVDMQLGKTNAATEEAARALKLIREPLAGEYILLAKLYDSQGDTAQSEAALRQAESRPDGVQAASVARAQIKMSHGDLRGAETILRPITARYPGDLLPWVQLGLALGAQKRYQEALSAWQQALKISPNDPSVHLLSAQALHLMGRDSESLEQCRAVLVAAPDNASAQALMAQISAPDGRR